jgi:hypothetical protein
MKKRPIGITIFALLGFLQVAVYATLTTLALVNHEALVAVLHALSPGGSGPEKVHLAMGKMLPLYYASMMLLAVPWAIGFWRLWNWTRWVSVIMIAVSFVVLLATADVAALRDGGVGAMGLFVLRLGLCLGFGWYLMSRKVRAAFTGQPLPGPSVDTVQAT